MHIIKECPDPEASFIDAAKCKVKELVMFLFRGTSGRVTGSESELGNLLSLELVHCEERRFEHSSYALGKNIFNEPTPTIQIFPETMPLKGAENFYVAE